MAPSNAVPLTVGIITYNPSLPRVLATIGLLEKEPVDILVIDNASANQAELLAKLGDRSNVECIPQDENIGIAAAINILFRRAESRSSRYIMPLDQDTQLEEGHCSRMLEKFEQLAAAEERVAAVGASVHDFHLQKAFGFREYRPFWRRRVSLPPGYHAAGFLISSGTLMAVDALASVGPMNEWLFIDSVDLDWCFRARYQGWLLAGVDDPVVRQPIGEAKLGIGPVKVGIRHHDPERYFTMTRNRRFLYRQPYTPWLWKLRDFPRALIKFLVLMVLSPRRGEVAGAHWRGLRAPLPKELD